MTPPANSPRNSRYGGPTAPRQQHPGSPRWTQYCTLATFGTASAFICCCGIPTGIRLIVGCLQPQCFDWVAELSSSLDLKRDPCDNFYEYVCGQKPAVNAFVRLSLSVHMSFFKKLITLDPDDEREALSMSEKRAAMLTLRCFQQAFSGRNHLGTYERLNHPCKPCFFDITCGELYVSSVL
ncbi:uncharacterized protein LOC144167639 [Haemaphysalis longicornis]